jgi:tRNA (mo5U34)-methyltransferase
VARELARELRSQPPWMYPWDLGLGRGPQVRLLHPELPSIHETRATLIEPAARAALAAAGPHATAIDLACSEGYFAHRVLEWGASRVVGIDLRPRNIRRAELVRDHLGIAAERLEFRCADVFALDPEELGTFDVVLVLGLIYHVEDPIGALRLARWLTGSLCVVESQLTRQTAPIEHGWGTTAGVQSADASFAVRFEDAGEANPTASAPGVLSLIPNRAALDLALRVAGFAEIQFLGASPPLNAQYVNGDRAVVLARP